MDVVVISINRIGCKKKNYIITEVYIDNLLICVYIKNVKIKLYIITNLYVYKLISVILSHLQKRVTN